MPQPLETYFDNIQDTVISKLQQSTREILAAVAWFTDWEIYTALQQAMQRGVRLSLILVDDDINNHSNLNIDALRNQGARIYRVPPEMGTMHHKYCIIDRAVLMMGSYNWTRKAANQNMESMMVVYDERTIEQFLGEYEKVLASIGETFVFTQSVSTSDIKPRLRIEIRLLENDVTLLEERKAGIVAKLEQLAHQLRQHLGELLIRYADLEARLAEQRAQKTGSRIDRIEYEEAQQKAQATREQVLGSAEKQIPVLDTEEQADIKKMYREAALMAHPDRFAGNPDKEAEATRLMAQLSAVYQENDVERVREIWQALKEGTAFSMDLDEIDDLARLELIRDKLLTKREALESDIRSLESTADWKVSEQYRDDLTLYFDEVKRDLELRIGLMERQVK